MRVCLFTPCSCLSIYQWTSIASRPHDLRELIPCFSFQAYCHGACERCLMNCLVRRGLCLPIIPPPCFCITVFIYSHISAAFCWAMAFASNWKSLGGVNSCSVERCIICWDLHVTECVTNTKKVFHSKTAVIPDTNILLIHWICQCTQWVISEVQKMLCWGWGLNWT